jgi:hypothetical protein
VTTLIESENSNGKRRVEISVRSIVDSLPILEGQYARRTYAVLELGKGGVQLGPT